MSIREVYPGTDALTHDNSYVEIQAYQPAQSLLGSHWLTVYNSTASLNAICQLPNGYVAPNSANQMTALIGDSFDAIAPDYTCNFLNSVMNDDAGGAACWGTDQVTPVDCVAWGNFTGSVASAVGTPADAIPNGMALIRTISPNCSTALDAADDTNDSATDFSLGPSNPRNNASPITETPCSSSSGGGGGANLAPNTKIKKRPKNQSHDKTPTFKFGSDEADSTFKCKLDHKPFKKCKSPKTFHGLDPGKHTFKVEAIDSAGNVDKTPAKDKFTIVG